MEGYMMDFEQLALKYSLPKLREALAALRIDPNQSYFPRPDEAAAQIERMSHRKEAEIQASRTRRWIDEQRRDFWAWVDFRMQSADMAGKCEQDLLDAVKVPGFMGMKART
jgi:hypothetical protein